MARLFVRSWRPEPVRKNSFGLPMPKLAQQVLEAREIAPSQLRILRSPQTRTTIVGAKVKLRMA